MSPDELQRVAFPEQYAVSGCEGARAYVVVTDRFDDHGARGFIQNGWSWYAMY